MEPEPGEVVTVMIDLSRVPLDRVPAPTARVLRRLTREAEQVSAFNSSI
jgi:FXSXX-COOH protein